MDQKIGTTGESVYDVIRKLAEAAPEKPIYRYRERGRTTEVSRMDFFHDLKNKRREFMPYRGKTAALSAANSYEYIVNCLGLVTAGCRTALLDSRWGKEETYQALERIEASLVLYDEDSENIFEDLPRKFPKITGRLLAKATAQLNSTAEAENCPEGDLLIFTSGTSGKAKIAITPIQSMLGHCRTICNQAICEKDEWWAIPVPFFHSFGFNMILLAMITETPLLISSMRYIGQYLKQGCADGLFAVPHLVEYLLDRNEIPHTVKKILTAGGRCPESLAQSCREQGIIIQNNYGSSELTACSAFSHPNESVDHLYYHSGIHPFISPEGELVLQTPFHLREYLGMPEETAAVLQADGLHTGDAAVLNANGFFSVKGRIADVIVLENGEKLLLSEAEEKLGAMPGVKEAVVLLLKNRLTVVFRTEEPDGQALMSKNVAEYNAGQPYALRIRDICIYKRDFPRTSSGKLIRRELVAELENRQ